MQLNSLRRRYKIWFTPYGRIVGNRTALNRRVAAEIIVRDAMDETWCP